MAKSRGEAVAKRAREQARAVKKQAKQTKREARTDDTARLSATNETALFEEFARLNAEREAGAISEDRYTRERSRILAELGIEPD